ncbi:uroporphyrin-III C-methyltransferase/precorrin-2 dehydrogenase/sirohydrochlorin ferrochelatase [Blastomyces silverae]|uniref:Uroporphyrin-III C-methyltransferase/precorrin-2 dehydrogenase/sirohydrochlorin ferrochelatase n=1 Tax=Blastomyces silverae TaxID=2060906 RepID=A0A0H1BRQ1_9EURO|nr:uroporphyrin-III C-methyltransferase/precorrin-2 dehydrogenase/sirohydrochlorin ferrochelatase [Blastomyces silverae]
MKDLRHESPGPAPMLAALDVRDQVHLIVGANPLAAARCTKCLDAGAIPIVIAPEGVEIHAPLLQKIEDGRVRRIGREFKDEDLKTLGRNEVDNYVDAVFVTLGPQNPLSSHIYHLCRRLRIPVNVSDAPDLCTFTLLSTYSDGPLHIGITTSGRGCKLAARLRREIAAYLPSGLGAAVETLGTVRRRIWEEDQTPDIAPENLPFEADDDDSTAQKHTFNSLVTPEDSEAAKTRRMRWLSQICEYWPLRRLASITGADMEAILGAYRSASGKASSTLDDGLPLPPKKGKIILAGSGPGHPDLLTKATHNAIKNADLILADKLVPAPVLDLIPRRIEVHIARKFPGNADKAQEELLEMGITALRAGRTVLRLKQGDPYLYGRGAEEYDFFRNEGYIPAVLPGITSALSAPLFADIPATHRGVSDQVLICTGTGRKGAAPEPPSYVPTQTVVFLMALHRLSSLIESLASRADGDESAASRVLWPKETPCAVIERASCADQRVIRSTLEHVCLAVQEEGSRPPGLLVVGASCGVLHPLTSAKWTVEDGFKGLDELGGDREMAIINELGAVNKT